MIFRHTEFSDMVESAVNAADEAYNGDASAHPTYGWIFRDYKASTGEQTKEDDLCERDDEGRWPDSNARAGRRALCLGPSCQPLSHC